MIHTSRLADGSLCITIQRCNSFRDHKNTGLKGRDGDICATIPAEAYKDCDDAEVLIARLRDRLGLADDE